MIPIPFEIPIEAISISIPLLHGAGASAYDELITFGGIGGIIVVLLYLSWRASKEKDKRRRSRSRSRSRSRKRKSRR